MVSKKCICSAGSGRQGARLDRQALGSLVGFSRHEKRPDRWAFRLVRQVSLDRSTSTTGQFLALKYHLNKTVQEMALIESTPENTTFLARFDHESQSWIVTDLGLNQLTVVGSKHAVCLSPLNSWR